MLSMIWLPLAFAVLSGDLASVNGVICDPNGVRLSEATISILNLRGDPMLSPVVSGKDGEFQVTNIPEGVYTFRVEHGRWGVIVRKLTVSGNKNLEVVFAADSTIQGEVESEFGPIRWAKLYQRDEKDKVWLFAQKTSVHNDMVYDPPKYKSRFVFNKLPVGQYEFVVRGVGARASKTLFIKEDKEKVTTKLDLQPAPDHAHASRVTGTVLVDEQPHRTGTLRWTSFWPDGLTIGSELSTDEAGGFEFEIEELHSDSVFVFETSGCGEVRHEVDTDDDTISIQLSFRTLLPEPTLYLKAPNGIALPHLTVRFDIGGPDERSRKCGPSGRCSLSMLAKSSHKGLTTVRTYDEQTHQLKRAHHTFDLSITSEQTEYSQIIPVQGQFLILHVEVPRDPSILGSYLFLSYRSKSAVDRWTRVDFDDVPLLFDGFPDTGFLEIAVHTKRRGLSPLVSHLTVPCSALLLTPVWRTAPKKPDFESYVELVDESGQPVYGAFVVFDISKIVPSQLYNRPSGLYEASRSRDILCRHAAPQTLDTASYMLRIYRDLVPEQFWIASSQGVCLVDRDGIPERTSFIVSMDDCILGSFSVPEGRTYLHPIETSLFYASGRRTVSYSDSKGNVCFPLAANEIPRVLVVGKGKDGQKYYNVKPGSVLQLRTP